MFHHTQALLLTLLLSLAAYRPEITASALQPSDLGSPLANSFQEYLQALKPNNLNDYLYPIPLGLPTHGTCEAGKEYLITKISDLYELIPEIECVWSQAITPNKVPLGAAYGRLLSFTNTAVLNWVMEFIYQGDYILRTQCNGNFYNIGVVNFGGLDLSTGIWTVSSLPSNSTFLPGEHYDGKPGVLMDFTVDIDDYCPGEGNETSWGPLKNWLPFNTGTWPYNLFVDMLRTVGRDEDGCILLLGRTWMREPYPANSPLFTVLFFVLKTCDPTVNPSYIRGTPLQPLAESYTYNRYGGIEFLKRLEPLGYFAELFLNTRPNGLYPYKTYINTPAQQISNWQPTTGGVKPILSDQPNKQDTLNPVLQAWVNMINAISKTFYGIQPTA